MAVNISDAEIAALIAEAKPLPDDYQKRVKTNPKRGHRERELDIQGGNGSSFRLILRQSLFNPLDFSVILAWLHPQSATPFRLCRYNGKSHEHTNKLESQTFYDFHVHRSTARYQNSGLREDSFAEPTNRYQDFGGALLCMIQECGFQQPANPQTEFFKWKVSHDRRNHGSGLPPKGRRERANRERRRESLPGIHAVSL